VHDLIYRQAAIDALKRQAETMSEWSNRYAEQRKGVLTAVNIVEDLPSAQPEVIRCKDCKKNPHWEWVGCPMTGKNTRKPDDFCSYAERRTDG